MLSMEANIRPPFSIDEARAILQKHYDIQPTTIKPMPSELDRNYHFRTESERAIRAQDRAQQRLRRCARLAEPDPEHLRATLKIVPELLPAKMEPISSASQPRWQELPCPAVALYRGCPAQRLPPAL